jgi:hypothetical protein
MNRLTRGIVDNRDPASLAAAFRRRRLGLFLSLIASYPRPVTILDVGGEPRFWEVMGLAGDPDYQVVLLNQARFQDLPVNLSSQAGDAADLSRFADCQFQAVFSNSVIEHLGSYERQKRMAAEVQRVGRCYFVQTPNRRFPIEPHFLAPFFQYYPERLQIALVQHFSLGWYPRIPEREQAVRLVRSHRLLDERELRLLFPDARLCKETVLGLVKSWVAYGSQENGLSA